MWGFPDDGAYDCACWVLFKGSVSLPNVMIGFCLFMLLWKLFWVSIDIGSAIICLKMMYCFCVYNTVFCYAFVKVLNGRLQAGDLKQWPVLSRLSTACNRHCQAYSETYWNINTHLYRELFIPCPSCAWLKGMMALPFTTVQLFTCTYPLCLQVVLDSSGSQCSKSSRQLQLYSIKHVIIYIEYGWLVWD